MYLKHFTKYYSLLFVFKSSIRTSYPSESEQVICKNKQIAHWLESVKQVQGPSGRTPNGQSVTVWATNSKVVHLILLWSECSSPRKIWVLESSSPCDGCWQVSRSWVLHPHEWDWPLQKISPTPGLPSHFGHVKTQGEICEGPLSTTLAPWSQTPASSTMSKNFLLFTSH